MSDYEIEFHVQWDEYFSKLDNNMQKRVAKKILQLRHNIPGRHLGQGLDFFVSEVGQYRLVYKVDEVRKSKMLYFVGDHKEYQKWLCI